MSALGAAVLLAGGRLEGALAARTGTAWKALVPVGGTPLLEIAWRAVAPLAPVVVVGPEEVRGWGERRPGDRWVASGPSGTENILRGLAEVPGGPCLLCASDMPFLDTGAVGSFLEACSAPADLHYPLVSKAEMSRAFPGYRRRYVPIREGWFTGGSAVLVRPAAVVAARATVERVFEARKNTLRLALMLGLPFLVGRLLGTLSVAQVERRAERLVGLRCRAVVDAPAALALDVDGPSDYEYLLSCGPRNPARRGEPPGDSRGGLEQGVRH